MHHTRFSLFVLLHLVSVMAGVLVGGSVGLTHFHTLGMIMGALLGFLVGALVGSLPNWLGKQWMFRSIQKSSTAELKACLHQGEWNFYQTMALLQLAARNEDVSGELPRIMGMLESDTTLTRVYGWDALRIVYTEVSQRIEDYNPHAPTVECRLKVGVLRSKE